MARKKQGRFSRYIRPITYLIDLSIINFFVNEYLVYTLPQTKIWVFIVLSFTWIIISIMSRFYNVYRYTAEIKILNLLLVQFILFTLAVFSFSGMMPGLTIQPQDIIMFVLLTTISIGAIKFIIYYFMLRFRADFGGNYRRTIIIGNGTSYSLYSYQRITLSPIK